MKTHGMSNTRIYRAWNGIKQRCTNKNDDEYKNYGGRGIAICKEWKDDFKVFYDWAIKTGYAEGLTIERIDNNKGYSQENCKWATPEEQANNKRNNITVNVDGNKITLAQLSRKLGISYLTMYHRFINGSDLLMKKYDKRKPVVRDDGIIYESAVVASKFNNASQSKISEVCRGIRKSTAGHKFFFLPPEQAEAALKEGKTE